MIGEQRDGIVYWKFAKDKVPSDSREDYGASSMKAVVTDRQFDSAENRAWLKGQKISNGLCPRDPK